MKPFLPALLSLFFCFSVPATAAETITVATDEWSSYTNQDGTGYYFDLLRAVFPEPEYKLDIKIVPYARSVQMALNNQAHVVLGIYKEEVPEGQVSKYVVEQDLVDALVSPELNKSWKGAESLAGKSVVAKIDYGFNTITDVKMNYAEKASLENMVKMLKAGRVDAVLDYEEDLDPIIKAEKLDDSFAIKKSVMGSPIYFGFSGDEAGKKYLKRFNEEYKKLWDAKKVHELMQKNTGDTGSLPKSQ